MTGLADIAAAAGVSVSTVSRVLNRRAGIKDETRQRVLDVLARMPHTARGAAAIRRTGVIGLLVPELVNPVFPAFAEALEARAARAGYGVLLCNTRAALTEEEHVRMLLARGVEGMLFVSPESSHAAATDHRPRAHRRYRSLLDDGVRMVFVNGGGPTVDVPDIAVDERLAGYLATRHLLDLGHRRIGFVSGPAHAVPSRLKRAGWAAALEEAAVDPDPELVAHADFGAAGGARACAALLDGPAPTGVLCSSDVMAFGALREARRRGLRLPDDLSVVGFDDVPLADCCAPSLTTIAQPIEEMADAAVAELLDRLTPELPDRLGGRTRMFRPRLVTRESTAPPTS
ncbi:LacI family DNA-binding transcriptional regulator [Saccharopolyspora gloriosae]|uniref:DNA-binding LacI/PurR family transcriptional regulator n=1 Tax=Saccharopolyspora gloriosae TaxID=455344 RepID=A0A840NFP7_9PSEU|nr:LacI family DNA-binding transcriptional regulator [Saccharopolyspora gloriosae]MBB5068139.1 DNA-binding LacI/PurR family transcriptional regulator [Saccharopolyspora gloriosae]